MSNRQLGQSTSTAAGRDTAVRLFDYYQAKVVGHGARSLANLTQDDILGDNLERKFNDFAYWLANTPIPKNPDRDDLLNPRASDALNPSFLGSLTLTQYLGRVRSSLSDRFPNHPLFRDPEEWTAMRVDFQTEVTRAQLTSSDGFGGIQFRCLYKLNSKDPRLYEFGRDDLLNDWVSKCDLKAVLRSLMQKARAGDTINGNLQRRCWLVATYHAMGRGGEIKFQNYADWVFDPRFEVTNIHWKELKKLASYAMPMMADMDGYECCFYHALGSFWLVETGLYRRSLTSADAQFVFPDLHRISDAAVARKLTLTIRENLPNGVPQPIKDSITVKSLRKATITTLAAHADISIFDSAGRSGHSTGTTQDSYIDRNCVALGLRGGRVLAGSASSRKDVCPPRMEWLGVEAVPHVNQFIDSLFIVSLEDFYPNGALYGVLRIVTAALVMYHKKLSQDFAGTQHVIVDKMVQAARAANIADIRCASTDPAAVLDYWSDVIAGTFNERNLPPTLEPSVAVLTATIQEQQAAMQSILTQLQSVKDELGAIRRGQQSQGTTLEQVKFYFSSFFRTPTRKRKSPPLDLPQEHPQPAGASLEAFADTPQPIQVATQPSPPTTPPPWPMMEQPQSPHVDAAAAAAAAEAVDASTNAADKESSQRGYGSVQTFNSSAMEVAAGSAKGVTVRKLLMDMVQTGSFGGSNSCMQDLMIPLYLRSEAAKVRSVLELVDLVATVDEKASLANKDSGSLMITNICKDLEDRAMHKMLVFEKGEGALANYSRAKPFVAGLGARVASYKKERRLTTVGQTPGTPPDSRSVRSFFQPRTRPT